MKPYKKILLATDFSAASDEAARRAKELIGSDGAVLSVIHVVNYIPPIYAGFEIPAEYASEEILLEKAENHLNVWVGEHELDDAERIVESGRAKDHILRVAEEKGADLIIIGAHGETGLARIFGSVANGVVQKASCDVLTVQT